MAQLGIWGVNSATTLWMDTSMVLFSSLEAEFKYKAASDFLTVISNLFEMCFISFSKIESYLLSWQHLTRSPLFPRESPFLCFKKRKTFTAMVVGSGKVAQRGCGVTTLGDIQNPAGSGPEHNLRRSSCGQGAELDNLPEVPSCLHYPLILWCLPYPASTAGHLLQPGSPWEGWPLNCLIITLTHTAFLLFRQLGPQQFQRNCILCILWKT